MTITLENITMAVTNLDEMVVFYNAVFETELHPTEPHPGIRAFSGTIAGIEWVLVPNTVAQVDAQQNRHQLQFMVTDAEKTIERAIANGGTPIDEAEERNGRIAGSVYDPDGNSLVFVQRPPA